jgi:hypothetical protein
LSEEGGGEAGKRENEEKRGTEKEEVRIKARKEGEAKEGIE